MELNEAVNYAALTILAFGIFRITYMILKDLNKVK